MYCFSINTQADLRVNAHYGYGKSLIEIKDSIVKSNINGKKISVEHNSPRSIIQMYYGPHPVHNAHYAHQFKIHMSQTESDRFEDHKVAAYSSADEFWTASEWGAEAAERSGIPNNKIFVYHHGLYSEKYPSFMRGRGDKIRFLHIDSGSPRKRSDLVEDCFNEIYRKNKNIELTLKYSHQPHKGKSWEDERQLASGGEWLRPGTRHIYETLSHSEMISLMNFHDVLVYPSEGEGFGLIPLEAMATGMPVISTFEWAPYAKYFSEGQIESDIAPSNIDWGYAKVGNGTIPRKYSVIEKMEYFIDNISSISECYFNRSDLIKSEYDWSKITPKFFSEAIERIGEDIFIHRKFRD